jgi:hypothetical protein
MRIHAQDTSETNRLDNLGNVARFNPDLDLMLLEIAVS